MDLHVPLLTGAILAPFTGIQVWINKGRFDAIEGRFDAIERRLDQMRSELLQIALALGAHSHPEPN
ncbi:MAG TPA: hypothetical protein VFA34_16605 [Actinomycetota bacterium]|nr:hypothetical protein [Actinomycetota bacterium]